MPYSQPMVCAGCSDGQRTAWAQPSLWLLLVMLLALTLMFGSGEAVAQATDAAAPVEASVADEHHDDDHHHDSKHHHSYHVDGASLGLYWVIPFVGMLLSIAIFPLVAPGFWHHHFGKISAAWVIAFLVPFTLVEGWEIATVEVLHAVTGEYVPFICVLLALFAVAGGIRVTGTLVGTPVVNLGLLFIGTVLASWMGTTGAAMLLIRPLIRANEHRRHKVHTIVFFIFLVANIGGSLTPLGDPPLFLGFLGGVDFFWPTVNMFTPMLLLSIALLAIYYVFDTVMFAREGKPQPKNAGEKQPLGLEGSVNFLLLGGVVAAVLMSGIWKPGISFDVFHVEVKLQNLVRDVLLIAITLLSLRLTDHQSRLANGFTWFPIVEVAKLFAAIFITMIPALAILKAGNDGALASVVGLVTGADGQPNNMAYFWLTGILSSFLDNAPTYLVFFNTAGGDAQVLMGELGNTLLAISAGAVFMGANTYIGNAPNFMVRSIAEDRGIPMPSFFGYMAWSCIILLPLFVVIGFLYF